MMGDGRILLIVVDLVLYCGCVRVEDMMVDLRKDINAMAM
jgi:hypothetical protein